MIHSMSFTRDFCSGFGAFVHLAELSLWPPLFGIHVGIGVKGLHGGGGLKGNHEETHIIFWGFPILTHAQKTQCV